jgi:hypothetical protein
MSSLSLIIFVLVILCVIAITWYVTQDARKRGFREFQVLLLALASIFLFPITLILYLILRPSVRTSD